MTINEIVAEIEKLAPIAYQELYDNAGLVVGEPNQQVSSVLICYDVTENIIEEAISLRSNLIISHHPVIFNGIKRFNGKSITDRIVSKAIKNEIALYAAHTNIDNVFGGINSTLCNKLGLVNQEILVPKKCELVKLVTFVPEKHADGVRNALFNAQAGHIGNYSCCSYNILGNGTFLAGEGTNPFVGKKGEIHTESEIRIETIVQRYLLNNTIEALRQSHPYEEIAYDVYPLDNILPNVGSGMVGNLPAPMEVNKFLRLVKDTFNVKCMRYSHINKEKVLRIAVCGGSGSLFINDAIKAKADVFITGDCKYHQFIDVRDDIILADIGHYESEYFAMEIFYEILNKKFSDFNVRLSKNALNQVHYM